MQLIDNQAYRDPAVNLALEEFLVQRFTVDEAILLFYINDPTVVIGRNQIPFVEVNLQKMWRQKAAVVRRISGGGAVYHGPGNLNFCLIKSRGKAPYPSPGDALRPVLSGLGALGLAARLNERHAILVDGKKITGSAQFRARRKCLTHGTLLVSADLEELQTMLAPDSEVAFFHGTRSVRDPVTNLNRYRPQLTMDALRNTLRQSFADVHGPIRKVALAPEDWAAIHHRAHAKYRSWDWNVGRSPLFTIRRRARLPWGWCEASITTKRGIVTHIETHSPEGAPRHLTSLSAALEGCRYHPDAVLAALNAAGGAQRTSASGEMADWLCPRYRWSLGG